MSSSPTSQADRLRAEGNTLFTKKNFKGAYKKYTEALKLDDKNAVLYSNRAACSLGMSRYLDASADATKATEIDEGYAKAWGRLAAARMGLNRVDQAIDAWTRALTALPGEKLTPAELAQRDQYNSELASAKVKLENLKANPKRPERAKVYRSWEKDKLPWERAIAILPGLAASFTWNSSAWMIERAYWSWERGLNVMKKCHTRQMAEGPALVGRLDGIEELSNALLEDSRAFHISDPNFSSLYNQQVTFEATMSKAWVDGGPKEVMQEAPTRLEAEGWESVRPALAVTVRGWVLRAFFEDAAKNNVETALEFYNSALEVLKWGAARWQDVDSEEKGAIFQPTIARGIKCLRLETLLKACKRNPERFSYDELLASADELLLELGEVPPEPHVPDIAFYLSFFRHPMGQGHSMRGYCLLNKAKRLREADGGDLTDDIVEIYVNASSEYLEAATCYPKDDERHPWFLHWAFHAQYDAFCTPRFALFVLGMLEESMPMADKIWGGFTPEVVREALEADLKTRDGIQEALDAKQLELDSMISDPFPGTSL